MARASVTVRDGAARLLAEGDWVVDAAAEIDRLLHDFAQGIGAARRVEIAIEQTGRIDTTGAFLILRARRALRESGVEAEILGLDEERKVLFDAVAARPVPPTAPQPPRDYVLDALAETGARTKHVARDALDMVGFLGEVVRAAGRIALDPRRLRFASIVNHIDRAGLRALPIVILISFVIGAIIAQQGAFQLRRFGADVFVVNLVGILVLREVGLLLAAIMFAGRTGSATTAEIGSMRMREEIDAMRVIGLDPVEVLVIPRLIAMIIALPIVTAIADFAALLGGLVTCWLYIDMDPGTYLQQLRNAVRFQQFMIGIVKAPFMAVIIGLIACLEGLRVRGSAESLGHHTTASVVKAIFVVIVVDGLFAVIFGMLDL